MTRLALALAIVTSMLAAPPPARAAGTLTRTFVSSAGVDTNPCTVTQPCASFAAAYNAVAADGIVAALDPGKYGPLTITGPVTIDGNGWAAITAPSDVTAAGILINAGSSDGVILRGLTLDGAGQANTIGIRFNSGGRLAVSGCAVRNMTLLGLGFASNGSTSQVITVSSSSFVSSITGISISANSSGAITGSIDHTQMSGNVQGGLQVATGFGSGTAAVAVTDSVATGNLSGFTAVASSTAAATLTVTGSLAVGNDAGVVANGTGATLFLAQSTTAGNNFGFQASSSGVINSFGDNNITETGHIGTLTLVSKQ